MSSAEILDEQRRRTRVPLLTRLTQPITRLWWPVQVGLGIGVSVLLARIVPPPNQPGTTVMDAADGRPFTSAPQGLEMPHVWQIFLVVLIGAMAAAMLGYAVHVARKTSSPLPLLFWLGGLAAVVLEPVADVMGNIIHAPGGAYTVFSVKGCPIPVHVLLCYPWYFGGLVIFLFDRMRAQSIERRFWWSHYAWVGILVPLVEVIPAHYGVWIYYGVQPFKIGATPDGMAAANICAVMLPALVIYKLLPIFKGWQMLLVVVLIPAFAMAGHAGSGVVLYIVLGQNTHALPWWVIQGSGLVAVGMSLVLVWLMIEMVYAPSMPADEPRAAPDSGPTRPHPANLT